MKKRLLIAAVFVLVMCALFTCHAERVQLTCAETGYSVIINTVNKNGTEYLFLPHWADISNLKFEKSGKVDMTKNKIDYVPGNSYKVTAGKRTVHAVIGSEIPSLFITLGEGYTIKWMAETADNRALNGNGVLVRNGEATESPIAWMHVRGNHLHSCGYKYSYTLKFENKLELIPDAGKAKKWILTANNNETKSGVGNYVGFKLYEMMNGPYALQQESVDVYIDGNYVGIYMLSEKAEVNKNRVDIKETENEEDTNAVTRVVGTCGLFGTGKTEWRKYPNTEWFPAMGTLCENVTTVMYKTAEEDAADPAIAAGIRAYQYATGSVESKPGGYLMEIEFRFNDIASWFVTRRGATIAVDSPEYATQQQVQEIAIWVQAFEDAFYAESGVNQYGLHYTDYMDLESLAKMVAIQTFMNNVDMFQASTFFAVDRKNGELTKIVAGPGWDFDFHEFYSANLLNEGILNVKGGTFSKMDLHPWIEQCFYRADLLEALYDLWHGEFGAAAKEMTATVLPAFNELTAASNRMNFYVLGGDKEQPAIQRDTNGVANRVKVFDKLVSHNYMVGGHVENDGDTLTLIVRGKYTQADWYRVNEDGSLTMIKKNGGASFTPMKAAPT